MLFFQNWLLYRQHWRLLAYIYEIKMLKMLVRSLFFATLLKAFMCACIYIDIFKRVQTDVGFEHYAEIPSMTSLVPQQIKMPWNTVVNLGYIIGGVIWMAKTWNSWKSHALSDVDTFVFYFFNWLCLFCAPIQGLRTVVQLHEFAIMDQWATLTFFIWVPICCHHILFGWNPATMFLSMLASVFSYGLTLVHHRGFEMALGCHMLLSVMGGLAAYKKYGNRESKAALIGGVAAGCGFVGLKLLDLYLPSVHPVFMNISGHFLSKVCDIIQIHLANSFFLSLVKAKRIDSKKKP